MPAYFLEHGHLREKNAELCALAFDRTVPAEIRGGPRVVNAGDFGHSRGKIACLQHRIQQDFVT
jgi:hypothetical protein